MSDAGIKIVGLARFRATMKRAGADMADMRAANQAAAGIVAAAGASRAPRLSGRLAASLRPARRVAGARITSNLPYAGVIHYGWPKHGISPNPFLTEAAAATQTQWLGAYERDLQKIVDSVSGA